MTAPAAPVITAHTDGDKIMVRLRPVSGAVSYNLYVDAVAGATTLQGNYAVTYAYGEWYQITFLASGPTFFRVTAVNVGDEESAYSNELELNPMGPGARQQGPYPTPFG
jgi:hypothetical protein